MVDIHFLKKIPYEKRIKLFALLSLFTNVIMCIAKFIAAAIFKNYFLLVAGMFNIFVF